MTEGTHAVGFIIRSLFTVPRTKICFVCHLGWTRDREEARM